MKHIIIFILFFISINLSAQIPSGYYDSAIGLEGEALKTELFNIIKNPNVTSYTGLWTAFKTTDRDNYYENDGTVMDMYSENPTGSDPYNYIYTSDQCGTYGVEGDCYNREHSFPKSWFNDASPMYSDLFHLYPTDGKVNGQRSNYPFGEVTSASWTSENGSKLGTCSYPGYTGTVFEPIDEFKGDFARTYFYMATCYEDKISGWSSAILNGTSYPCYSTWYINMLLEWNQNDPVSQKEIDRNNAVYGIQDNRNPYIDHPEWVNCVWSSCGIQNPDNLNASAISTSEIDLDWILNSSGDQIVLAFNTTNTFGTPTGTYTAGNTISGGGEVLYVGTNTSFSHTGLSSQMYYYKIWSYDGTDYSSGIETSSSPLLGEPTNNPISFVVSNETSNSITLSWTDATGGQLPSYYLIKASTGTINNPTDGIAENNTMSKNVAYGTEILTFTGLSSETTYNFKIFPYTNSGSDIDYKTDNNPTTSGTTLVATDPILVITEIAGKGYDGDYNDEYIEISNIGDMSADLTNWSLEYYEGSSVEADLDLTGSINPLSTYVIAVRTSHTSAINPNFTPASSFSINNPCYVILKENGTVKDQAGSSSDLFDAKNINYEFTSCSSDNLPVSNWTDLDVGNGTPGTINCSDISVASINSKIKIYPNPANQVVNINSVNIIENINVYSVIGQKVLSFNNLNTNTYEINIKNLIKGVYFIEVIDKVNNKTLKKLIKE